MSPLPADRNLETDEAAVFKADLPHQFVSPLARAFAGDQELRGIAILCELLAQDMRSSHGLALADLFVSDEQEVNPRECP